MRRKKLLWESWSTTSSSIFARSTRRTPRTCGPCSASLRQLYLFGTSCSSARCSTSTWWSRRWWQAVSPFSPGSRSTSSSIGKISLPAFLVPGLSSEQQPSNFLIIVKSSGTSPGRTHILWPRSKEQRHCVVIGRRSQAPQSGAARWWDSSQCTLICKWVWDLSLFFIGWGAQVYGDASICFERLQGGGGEDRLDRGGSLPSQQPGIRKGLDELDGQSQLDASGSKRKHRRVERSAGKVEGTIEVAISEPTRWVKRWSLEDKTQLTSCQPGRLVLIIGVLFMTSRTYVPRSRYIYWEVCQGLNQCRTLKQFHLKQMITFWQNDD